MKQNRWQIGFLSVSIPFLLLAAGCTGTDFIDSGNSNVSFEIVTVGSTSQPYDCIQWAFGDLRLRPLDGTCAADSVNAGDPCLSTTDCDPLPGQTGTCVGSESLELVGDFGILVVASPAAGNILGGDCNPTIDAGGICEGLFELVMGVDTAVPCFVATECGFCEQAETPCDTDADCIGADECNQQAACVNPSGIQGAALVPPRSLTLSPGVYEISVLSVGRAMLYEDVHQPPLNPPRPFFRGCAQPPFTVVDAFGDALRFTVLPDQDKRVRFAVDSGALEQNLPGEDICGGFEANITSILECETCDAAP